MTVRQPRHSKEEFARREDEFYESQVRSQADFQIWLPSYYEVTEY